MPTTHLLYLHGFRSSPQSTKAQQVAAWVKNQHPDVVWWCPQLPPSPREAAQMLSEGIAGWPRSSMAVMGSSLGGFYATHVAETCGCKAVLLNPAVNPARDLAKYIGEQSAWHDPNERFFFEPGFVDELRALAHGPVANPGHYFAIIAKGDEVLDWREMTGRYPGVRFKLLEGGDHALSDFEAHLPEVMDFLAGV
ncbi:YqiA/YcfP family alpha/beta fold hydrolase [Polaromonas sp. SM01]|uniref:YqiA/YcfP family alpha/beta fold hydrolase n=1 Tax=Polaromonas sp. SM01 TaxID=3085630 RepID=UPI0029819042|nr:YqiA/YcfP family alpha/beta fold hydrolase [Polaromonas sp. SM01]MDW5445033.1 YqiA/YcfP family alpha/beta fold hydrolase [Polaromonas sp. SM01]